jgi:hypothetical protein
MVSKHLADNPVDRPGIPPVQLLERGRIALARHQLQQILIAACPEVHSDQGS